METQSQESRLQENPSLLEFNGVINRMSYFINSAILIVCFGVSALPLLFGFLGAVISVPLMLGLCVVGFVNNMKRLRDVRGTDQDELRWGIGLFVALCVPYLNIIPNIALLFMEGAITGNGKGLETIETAIASAKVPSLHKVNSSSLESVEKLYKLKEMGAITNEEFEQQKAQLLKKVA